MKVETDFAKVDWDGLKSDFLHKLHLLQIAWQGTQSDCSPAMHEKIVEGVYVPILTKLAEFVTSVEELEEEDEDGSD